MSINELLRLACYYAENDRRAYLDSIKGVKGYEKECEETQEFIDAVKAYRSGRWGQTRGDALDEAMKHTTPVTLEEAFKPRHPDDV